MGNRRNDRQRRVGGCAVGGVCVCECESVWDLGHGCFVRWAKQEAATAAATAATAVDEDEAAAVAAATGARPVRCVRAVVQVPPKYLASHPIPPEPSIFPFRYGSVSDVVVCRYLHLYLCLFGPDGMRWHGMAWHGKGRGNSAIDAVETRPNQPMLFVLASVTLLELPAADKLQQVCLLSCASVRCSGRPTLSFFPSCCPSPPPNSFCR